jgi:hypothetical protein
MSGSGLVGARFGMLTVLADGLRTSPNADQPSRQSGGAGASATVASEKVLRALRT